MFIQRKNKLLSEDCKIYVAGHTGMVGSAIIKLLSTRVGGSIVTRSSAELDLTDQKAVDDFFKIERPNHVYLAAAKVGGIIFNQAYPADIMYQNLMMQANVIQASFKHGVKKLLFLGSSCIYPKLAAQPMTETALLGGYLEPTNEPYALAKIAGIKLCESFNRQYGKSHDLDFRSIMPSNLYGPGDNYHPENSHVIPGLIVRFHQAKQNMAGSVDVWGTGKPRREFLYVSDIASASVQVMNVSKELYEKNTQKMLSHVNIGYGSDISIQELAELVARVVSYKGTIKFDKSKPDGTPQKLMDSSIIKALGWEPRVSLEEGLLLTYEDFLRGL